jgi:hypothetical protein
MQGPIPAYVGIVEGIYILLSRHFGEQKSGLYA